jgi:hypothetical protein
MALDPDQIVVAGSGRVYTGTVGVSTIPTNVSAAIDIAGTDGWVELGYTSEKGVAFSFGRDAKEIKGWQSRNPLRQVITGTPSTFKCELLQINHATLRLARGGGSVTGSNPNFNYTPPPASFRDERSFIVEAYDGDYTYRFIFRKGLNVAAAEFSFVREDPTMLPIEISILDDDTSENPWGMQTNDPEIGQFALVGT